LDFEGPLVALFNVTFIAEIMKVDPISIFTIRLIIARNLNENFFKGFCRFKYATRTKADPTV